MLGMHLIETESEDLHIVIGLMVEHDQAYVAGLKRNARLVPNTAHQLTSCNSSRANLTCDQPSRERGVMLITVTNEQRYILCDERMQLRYVEPINSIAMFL